MEVAELRFKRPFQETVALLEQRAQRCWAAPVNPVRDGVSIEVSRMTDDVVISGHRLNWTAGRVHEPFIVVHVRVVNDETLVTVSEGDFASGMAGSKRLEAARDVPLWLGGDLQCRSFARSLVNL
jgi:hypothetical protein